MAKMIAKTQCLLEVIIPTCRSCFELTTILLHNQPLIYYENAVFLTIGKTLKGELTLQQLGLQPGSVSKAILMHSPGFQGDQEAMEKITKLNEELDLLEMRKTGEESMRKLQDEEGSTKTLNKQIAQHLITDICCKLDLIDINGSETLREIRKKVLRRAENLDKLWQNKNDDDQS